MLKTIFTFISSKLTSITHVFSLLALIVGILLFIYDARYFLLFEDKWDFINNVIVEAHGLFFDLVVLGVLISIYEGRRRRKEAIEFEKNMIDDFREWPEKEAKFRIIGAIKRLIKEGEKKINLRKCYLEGTSFADWNLSKSQFDMANLDQATFYQTKLIDSSFKGAKLNNATFYSVDITGADFSEANLEGTTFSNTNLSAVNFEGAIVLSPIIIRLENTGKKLYPYRSDDWFLQLENDGTLGVDEIRNKYYVNEYGILQLNS